jgi:hypothetical protein
VVLGSEASGGKAWYQRTEKDGLKYRLAEIVHWDLTGQFLLAVFTTNANGAGAVCDQQILVCVPQMEKSKQSIWME